MVVPVRVPSMGEIELFNDDYTGNHLTVANIELLVLMSRVFANGPGDRCSIPGRVIPKTQNMLVDAGLLKTQHYKVQIKGKMEQYGVVAI